MKLLGQRGDILNFYVHIVDSLPEADVLINILASIIMKFPLQTPSCIVSTIQIFLKKGEIHCLNFSVWLVAQVRELYSNFQQLSQIFKLTYQQKPHKWVQELNHNTWISYSFQGPSDNDPTGYIGGRWCCSNAIGSIEIITDFVYQSIRPFV